MQGQTWITVATLAIAVAANLGAVAFAFGRLSARLDALKESTATEFGALKESLDDKIVRGVLEHQTNCGAAKRYKTHG